MTETTSSDEFAMFYGEVCDVIARTHLELPLEDETGWRHTSNEARAGANRIIDLINDFGLMQVGESAGPCHFELADRFAEFTSHRKLLERWVAYGRT